MSQIEDLEKLNELKKKGIITEDEFEQKKQSILSSNLKSADVGTSPKSRTVYGVLGFFLGLFGIHNFYLGRKIQGFFQIFVWALLLIGFIFSGVMPVFLKKGIFIIGGFLLIIYIFVAPLWIGLNLLLTKRDGKKRLMRQDGKTVCMVFGIIVLLSYLLVIPTCSIGGLAGYSMAMNRHRVNEILDYVAQCSIVAQTKDDGYSIQQSTCSDLLPYKQAPNSLNAREFIVSAAGRYDETFKITTPIIKEKNIRKGLIDRSNYVVSIKEIYGTKVEFEF